MIVTLVVETDNKEQLFQHLDDRGFNYYELADYWDVEKFTTIEEVQEWMETDA